MHRNFYSIPALNVPKAYQSGAEMDEDFVDHVVITAVTAIKADKTDGEILYALANNGLPKAKLVIYGAWGRTLML